MKFILEVGESRRHIIEYEFNQLLGRSVIRLDREQVERRVRLFNEPICQTHQIDMDADERLKVRIEKERKWLFGHKCRVFLNNRLVKCYEGV